MNYFVREAGVGHVKIGTTQCVRERLKGLQTSTPRRLFVLREIEGDRDTEAWLHDYFEHLRIDGEWFLFDEEMLDINPPEQIKIEMPVHPVTAALRKRVGPGKVCSPEQLAKAVGASTSSVLNWLNGTLPGASKLEALWQFFDADFFAEITGFKFEMQKPDDPKFMALSKIAEGMAELQRMEGQ